MTSSQKVDQQSLDFKATNPFAPSHVNKPENTVVFRLGSMDGDDTDDEDILNHFHTVSRHKRSEWDFMHASEVKFESDFVERDSFLHRDERLQICLTSPSLCQRRVLSCFLFLLFFSTKNKNTQKQKKHISFFSIPFLSSYSSSTASTQRLNSGRMWSSIGSSRNSSPSSIRKHSLHAPHQRHHVSSSPTSSGSCLTAESYDLMRRLVVGRVSGLA